MRVRLWKVPHGCVIAVWLAETWPGIQIDPLAPFYLFMYLLKDLFLFSKICWKRSFVPTLAGPDIGSQSGQININMASGSFSQVISQNVLICLQAEVTKNKISKNVGGPMFQSSRKVINSLQKLSTKLFL